MAGASTTQQTTQTELPLDERLERGELIVWTDCPFALPHGEDLAFLMTQRQSRIHKNISFNPENQRISGFCRQSLQQTEKLRDLLCSFGEAAATWLAGALPRYASAWRRDRVSLRPEEEAIRPLRLTARNDLLHVDAFPNRPTQGARILRLYVNINPAEPRVWMTSETIVELCQRYAAEVSQLAKGWPGWRPPFQPTLARLFDRGASRRSRYDLFMLRFHHFLKANDRFQERSRRRFWHFPPGSMWLAFTDGLSHAVLRGRYLLEHSFFIPQAVLALPDESPLALFERAGRSSLRAA